MARPVRLAGYTLRLLDPPLFWRKFVMLVVFFGLFIPLKLYQEEILYWYVVFLVGLHVYVFFVFLYRVRWKVLAENRRPFAVRVIAIVVFVFLLTIIRAGATAVELAIFVALSLLVHVALLLSLTVDVRPEPAGNRRLD